jgi:hypothetical protein
MYSSDYPHADRTEGTAKFLKERDDITPAFEKSCWRITLAAFMTCEGGQDSKGNIGSVGIDLKSSTYTAGVGVGRSSSGPFYCLIEAIYKSHV